MACRFGFADEDDAVDELPCNGFLVVARVAEIMDISESALQPCGWHFTGLRVQRSCEEARFLKRAASDSGRGLGV